MLIDSRFCTRLVKPSEEKGLSSLPEWWDEVKKISLIQRSLVDRKLMDEAQEIHQIYLMVSELVDEELNTRVLNLEVNSKVKV